MGENIYTAVVWIRPEDADHPKLERLRRVVAVSIGPDADVSVPWLVWGNGLGRSWLFGMLDVRFISSLPVILRSAWKAWGDREPVQIVAAEDETTPVPDGAGGAFG